VSDFDECLRRLKGLQAEREHQLKDITRDTRRIRVDKRTHRIRFESETEESVTIVIEKKDGE
jgi:hypothetical protein